MWSGSNCKKAKEGIDFPNISAIIRVFVTVQQVCAFTALTVRKLGLEGKNPIGIADLEWILRVTVRILNSYECLSKNGFPWDGKRPGDKGEER